ncbi:hypothetical protein [Glycomyces buryatensis]|uniref:Uncharacterized protein n=1 Tax=Glycomyces buryatensis TaxID=2570927 RepID=A0A4S8QLR0_9ACTN|nr:hypothetical protein [Glycomyces buryatensis]THV41674.1 hypothetical protein FAB82_09770 [Glycomyces buryatensis]
MIALTAGGCGDGNEDGSGSAESGSLDTSGPGYLQPGTEFWDGWAVPAETVLLGSPFPQAPMQDEGMPDNPEPVSAELLVTGEPHDVMRDLFAQFESQGLDPVLDEGDEAVCEALAEFWCELHGQGEDGYTKASAYLTVTEEGSTGEERYPQLNLHFGTYSWLDVPLERYSGSDTEYQEPVWVDAEAPQGDSGIEAPVPEADGLAAGSELPFFGWDEPLGVVPEGARLLAPPYSPSATYGFAGIFSVEDEAALGELAAMAEEAATGDKLADEDLTAGELRSHHVSYDGSGGGCGVDFDNVTPADGAMIVRLDVVCD